MKTKLISLSVFIILFFTSMFLGKLYFSICMSFFAILSLREILYIRPKDRRVPGEIELLSYLLVIFFVMNNYNANYDFYLIDYRLVASLILLDLIPLVIVENKKRYNLANSLYLIASTMFIGIVFNLIVQFRSYNINYVTYIFLIAFFTDMFALITGKLIGEHKFMEHISPKKTLEGAVGGLIMGTIVPTLFFASVIDSSIPMYVVFIVTMLLSSLGQVGDLVFSCIKREFGKKDFSNVIVGNGGILDIIDSVIFITLGFILIISIV